MYRPQRRRAPSRGLAAYAGIYIFLAVLILVVIFYIRYGQNEDPFETEDPEAEIIKESARE